MMLADVVLLLAMLPAVVIELAIVPVGDTDAVCNGASVMEAVLAVEACAGSPETCTEPE